MLIALSSVLGAVSFVFWLVWWLVRMSKKDGEKAVIIQLQQADRERLKAAQERLARIKRRQSETNKLIPDDWDTLERVRREQNPIVLRPPTK